MVCIKKSKKNCTDTKKCIWVKGSLRQYCRKSKNKKIFKNNKNFKLKKFGIRNEEIFIKSLIDDDNSKLVKWICNNIPFVINGGVFSKKTEKGSFDIIGFADPQSKSENIINLSLELICNMEKEVGELFQKIYILIKIFMIIKYH